jgi:methylase of polypeptide subunit release factors
MRLDHAHDWLGWPNPGQILDPEGAGAKVYADFAKQKIGAALKRKYPQLIVETGILAPDPNSASTEAPLAVVCQFPNGARPEELKETHRLAWNFSRTALLVTLEPHRLIAWTCYQDPGQPEEMRRVCELPTAPDFKPTGTPEQRSVRDLLHWVSLITGHILRQHPEHFPADGRADALLLKNLRHIRRELVASGLPKYFCHDLLARVIFTQFLFHRKDSDGNPFFSQNLLQRKCDGALCEVHADLASILASKSETYALFRWMDDRFNGDLFPGREDQSDSEREAAWQAEKDSVSEGHLTLLADLVAGTMDTSDRQLRLWPEYSFDTIPLEFISSVYEEFLNEEKYKNKAFYTPSHLVDYLLDAVLPWDGEEWDLRILDPACGSGIFLVKAFQRLIYRWRRVHGREPLVRDLKPILAKNLVGVDINPEAVRVACFSLYLAMADAIEPKHYVTREKVFPRLRGARLIAKDFFDESTPGFRTKKDARTFDLVIGNPPWGDKSIKKTSHSVPPDETLTRRKKREQTKAEKWASDHKWPVANNDIGPLFLAKGAGLANDAGQVAMVQPAPTLLYQRANPARRLRQRLFSTFTFAEVTNLAALRRDLFGDVIGPACIVVFRKETPDPNAEFFYFAPKPRRGAGIHQGLVVEPQDISTLTHKEGAGEPTVWSILALGGRRDLNLIRKLSSHQTLAKLKARRQVITRGGVVPGDRKKELPELRGKRYFDAPEFPKNVFLELNAATVPKCEHLLVDSLHGVKDCEAFKQPQLLIKQSYSARLGRFRAATVRSSDSVWGVVCKETYLTVSDLSPDASNIRSACLAYNSLLATYFLALTSSRMGHYITEIPTKELMTVPLPDLSPDLAGVDSFEKVDSLTKSLFSLTLADWTIVEDFLQTTLPDALRTTPGPGRQPTLRKSPKQGAEPELSAYGRTFKRVLQSTFGKDKPVCATIYQEPDNRRLPVRMVTIHLDWPGRESLKVDLIEADGLLDKIAEFHRNAMQRKGRAVSGDGLGFQRVAFLFHSHKTEQGRVRNLTVIKPDERRYWTRSLAMRDADDLAGAILKAAGWKGHPE